LPLNGAEALTSRVAVKRTSAYPAFPPRSGLNVQMHDNAQSPENDPSPLPESGPDLTLRGQLEVWLAAKQHFINVKGGRPTYRSVECLRRATVWAAIQLKNSGESSADELQQLESLLHSMVERCLTGDGETPEGITSAISKAEAEILRVLEQQPPKQLPAKPESLMASLAVSVLEAGGVLSKQEAHLQHTGADLKSDRILTQHMTPKSPQWKHFGSVDGDFLRMSEAGREMARRLQDLGAVPLDQRKASS
jgi:hypothetical protein